MKVIDWWLGRKQARAETSANIDLLKSLQDGLKAQGDRMRAQDERIASMEGEQNSMRNRLDEEIAMRRAAEETAHKLKLKVYSLEAALRGLGVVIPADPTGETPD